MPAGPGYGDAAVTTRTVTPELDPPEKKTDPPVFGFPYFDADDDAYVGADDDDDDDPLANRRFTVPPFVLVAVILVAGLFCAHYRRQKDERRKRTENGVGGVAGVAGAAAATTEETPVVRVVEQQQLQQQQHGSPGLRTPTPSAVLLPVHVHRSTVSDASRTETGAVYPTAPGESVTETAGTIHVFSDDNDPPYADAVVLSERTVTVHHHGLPIAHPI